MGPAPEIAYKWAQAARLHDVGKRRIPDTILLKLRKLNEEEFDIMRQLTTTGASILGEMYGMDLAQDIALSHHEHWDGSGYPEGKVADQKSSPARIVGIADVFDALVNIHCYEPAWSIEEAIQYIKKRVAASSTQR